MIRRGCRFFWTRLQENTVLHKSGPSAVYCGRPFCLLGNRVFTNVYRIRYNTSNNTDAVLYTAQEEVFLCRL